MLYHYTSYEKFTSIIQSQSLWLTSLADSNDESEIKQTFEILWNKIYPILEKGIKDLDNSEVLLKILSEQMQLETLLSTQYDEKPYALCFTKNRDSSTNWHEYGDQTKGLVLCFSEELLDGIEYSLPHPNSDIEKSVGWNHVVYSDENDANKFAQLFIEEMHKNPNTYGWLCIRTTLKHYSAFIKSKPSEDEREIRIVCYPEYIKNKNDSKISICIEDSIPHCSLPIINHNGKCALKEIIIGNSCQFGEKEIRQVLSVNGIENDIKITKSEYLYRVSENR